MKEEKLNTKQELFCKLYIEYKGNWTKAYMEAYNSKTYETAKVGASRMISNEYIGERIYWLLKDAGYNDINIDMELAELIKQDENLGIKLRAIIEYNKLRRRYEESPTNILNNTWMIFLPSREKDAHIIEANTKPLSEMTMHELHELRMKTLNSKK